ncbi:MAG: TRAP transporter large permease subunit [Castellaniella sp.]|uniref:TRAP transporter large permease n=1 Tax=Castellaniella sp. TaxID=1955812 RepID=UPI00122A131C|nr:TRAP transporter large permease subunit [Castellaniella sp.]TAN25129.1 MAG: TRAP transporter large permease subunit [Castellaniella sp.]
MIIVALGTVIGLLALAVPVAASLGTLSIVLADFFSTRPILRALGQVSWSTSTDFLIVAIPFFVLLGEILLRSGMAERMYKALALWVPWLPGGLMHTNIASCAMFAATSGSSVATAATIGTVVLDEIERNEYPERLFLGSIAAGGTLGILIPPSINMIVYGVLTDTSIPRLYLAGVVPGLLMALLFSLIIVAYCMLFPAKAGRRMQATWAARIRSLPDLLPPIFIFAVVIGSIYAGWATATEAAGLGVIAALIVAAWNKRLTVQMLLRAFEGTMRTNAMIMAVLLAAYALNFILAAVGLTADMRRLFVQMDLSPVSLLLVVVLMYLILGMFLETLSMMVLTVPIIAPVMVQAGFDPVWTGIIVIIMMEVGMITPPVGMNLFVVQGLRKKGVITDVILGALPFLIGMFAVVAAISVWPDIALWLPSAMRG